MTSSEFKVSKDSFLFYLFLNFDCILEVMVCCFIWKFGGNVLVIPIFFNLINAYGESVWDTQCVFNFVPKLLLETLYSINS
jgi:hypothetical protein